MSDANAALTPRHRLRIARLIIDDGWAVADAAHQFNVSWPTAKRWADRYAAMGAVGMEDRSSRPHRSPNRTAPELVRRIGHLRWKQRLGPVGIGWKLDMPASTVHAVLVRLRLNRLHHVDKRTGEVSRRYEHDKPGAMIHVDVTKFGNIPDGGGHRFVGRQQGNRNRAATPGVPRSKHRKPLIGKAFVHTVIDDHSCVAYAEIHRDRGAAPGGVLVRRARHHYRTGALRQRLRLKVPRLAGRLRRAEHPGEENPPLPAADQREDRTLPPHPRRRLGLQTAIQQRISTPQRTSSMAPRTQSPQAPHRNRRPPTHQPVN